MDPVIEYDELKNHLKSYWSDSESKNKVRMIGILFARPASKLTHDQIIPQIADWHWRSGKNIDFFFAGYSTYPHPPIEGSISVSVPGRGDWLYIPELFNKFREQLEQHTSWKYSGACDLLLTNAYFNNTRQVADIDFKSTIVCQLDGMVRDNTIHSIQDFFEQVFRFAETSKATDPCWGFSDSQGINLGASALQKAALSLLPGRLGDNYQQIQHVAIRDISAPTES